MGCSASKMLTTAPLLQPGSNYVGNHTHLAVVLQHVPDHVGYLQQIEDSMRAVPASCHMHGRAVPDSARASDVMRNALEEATSLVRFSISVGLIMYQPARTVMHRCSLGQDEEQHACAA